MSSYEELEHNGPMLRFLDLLIMDRSTIVTILTVGGNSSLSGALFSETKLS